LIDFRLFDFDNNLWVFFIVVESVVLYIFFISRVFLVDHSYLSCVLIDFKYFIFQIFIFFFQGPSLLYIIIISWIGRL